MIQLLSQNYQLLLLKLIKQVKQLNQFISQFIIFYILNQQMSFFHLKQLITAQKFQDFQQNIQQAVINQTDLDLLLREAIKSKCKNFQRYFNPLIRKGANVNFVTGQAKLSNLMLACESGTIQMVQCLVSNDKIDLGMQDNRRQNALYYAIFNKSKNEGEQVLKLILQKSPGLINSLANNKTLLILAIEKCKLQIVRLLLNKGADLNHVIPDSGNTALHEVIKLIESKQTTANKQIMRLLIQHGADLTIKNKTGKTPLQFAKKIGDQILKYQHEVKNQKKQNISSSDNKLTSKKEILIQANTKSNKQALTKQTKIEVQKSSDQTKKVQEIYLIKNQKIIQDSDSQSNQNFEENEDDSLEEDQPYLSKQQIVKQLQSQIILFTQDCQAQYRHAQTDTRLFLERLRQICGQYNLNLQIYGSFATGLWIKNCDIDLLLIPNSEFQFKDQRLNTNLKVLAEIKRQLQKQRKVKSIMLNQKIKVPMLRLQIQVDQEYNPHGNLKTRKIDITVLDSSHNGLQIVAYIHNNIKNWPQLIGLFYVIKSLTFHYKLHDPKNGGIRTYAIIIMILSFFQRVDITQFYNLGQLLMRFLYFFGYEYQYEYGYEIQSFKYNSEQKNYSNFKQHKSQFGMILTICDPLNLNSNIGKNTKAFSLQAMFKAAYIALHSNIDQKKASPQNKTTEVDKKSSGIKRLNFMFDTKKIMGFI